MSDGRLQRLLARFVRFAAEADAPEDARLRKIIGAVIMASGAGTYLLYSLLYIAFNEHPAGLAAMTGGLVTIAILVSYGICRRYTLHWTLFMCNVALVLTSIHFLLGGFRGSAMVIIWLITVPVLTIVADTPRRGLVWALVVAALVIAAALVDPYVARESNFSPALVITLGAMNVLGLAAYMLLAVSYYVWRIDAIGKRVAMEREARMRDLETASRRKSEFLANMSHELRTPLNAILGFSEVLSEGYFGELNAKQAEYMQDIHGSGKHLLALVNDILDLSKVEAGSMELELSEFDLPAALQDAMTLVRERALRHGINLQLCCDASSCLVVADPRKLKQILLNLLSNAVKFTPAGGAVTVSAHANAESIEIAVTDTGAGIALQDQAAVFEEFRQVGSDSARKAEGTGLGLPLAKRFVEMHGGLIWLESALGKGSTFTVRLPIRPVTPAEPLLVAAT